MTQALLHPLIPKKWLASTYDPEDVQPFIQLLVTVNGLPKRVYLEQPGKAQILTALQHPQGDYTVFAGGKDTQHIPVDVVITRKQGATPLADGDWIDPMNNTWTINRNTPQPRKVWDVMLYALDELQEHDIVLGGMEPRVGF